jgi:hypothetical protein
MRRKITHAQTVIKSAALSTDFGLDYATRLFGEEAIASLPLLKSGPNKGKPKGHIMWRRTTTAGYCEYVGGGVGPNVTVRAWIGEFAGGMESGAMQGLWLGRVQSLCGSRALLGQEARDRAAREQAENVHYHHEVMAESYETVCETKAYAHVGAYHAFKAQRA